MKRTFLIAVLSIFYLSLYATDPVVTTSDDYVRGATFAFYWGSVTANGNAISQRGICHATTPNPTVDDFKVTGSGTTFRCRLNNLEAGARHYVRAFAITSAGTVYYGENKTFTTIPEGQVKFVVNYNASEDADSSNYKRIYAATKAGVSYYNKCTSIKNVTITSNYVPGVTTADCSYGGWIRFGTNTSYQRTGTALHEMAHGVGVGTHTNWSNWGSQGWLMYNGVYQGNRANRVIQLMSNDPTAYVKGDSQHFWGSNAVYNYGINGANEDGGTEMQYMVNAFLVQAMGEDGLPLSSSYNYATPYESFIAESGQKYYFKNELASQGRDTKFLCANASNQLVQETMTPDEALLNDKAAWYIEFLPAKQLYTIRNVATNAYMYYSAANSVSGFILKDSAAVTSFTIGRLQLQLFPNRNSIMVGESVSMDLSGYQILYPTNALQCITSKTSSIYSAAATLTGDASASRWVILNAAQVSKYEVVVGNVRDDYTPDTNAVYVIRPKDSELSVKAYATNKIYLVEYRADDNNQRWKLKPVMMADSTLCYCLWNVGTDKCMTLQKWTGTRTSAKAASNTKMLAYDAGNLNQQLRLRTVELDLSSDMPVRYLAIENDHVIDDDSIVHRLDHYGNIEIGAQLKNCFDESGVLESQVFRLVEDSIYDAIPAVSPEWSLVCNNGQLFYQHLPSQTVMEIYHLTGEVVLRCILNDADGILPLSKGMYIVKLRSNDNTGVYKIISR